MKETEKKMKDPEDLILQVEKKRNVLSKCM